MGLEDAKKVIVQKLESDLVQLAKKYPNTIGEKIPGFIELLNLIEKIERI